jgi:hypothetical protein
MSVKKEYMLKTVGFVMIFSAFFLMALPVLSTSLIHYGKPTYAGLKGEGDSKKLVLRYAELDNLDIPSLRLQTKLHFPVKLSAYQSFFMGIAMFFVFTFFMGLFTDLEQDDDALKLTVPALFIVIIFLIIAPLLGASIYDVRGVLSKTFSDKSLVDAIVRDFWLNTIIIRMFISVIALFVLALFFHFFVGYLQIKIWEGFIVARIYNGWKARVFADILRNRRDSILSDFVSENQEGGNAVEGATRQAFCPNDEILTIQANGNIELVKYSYRLEWRPFPIFVLKKELVNSVSMNNFFRYLMADSKDMAFAELRDKLRERYDSRFGQVGERAIIVFVQGLLDRAKEEFNQLLFKAQKKELGSSLAHSERQIGILVNKVLRKFKSEVAKISAAEIDSILTDYCEHLISEVHSRMTLLREGQEGERSREGCILPLGTRFHVRKGDYDFFVIEQAPSVRTISVSSNFLRIDNQKQFSLAFPYVVFLLVFERGRLQSQYTSYRNRPLESLGDRLCLPNLSNMDGLGVCTGFGGHRVDGLAARVSEVISHFWASEFNNDLKANFDSYSRREETLKNFATWEKNSKKNPLFVLDIDWRPKCSLRELLMESLDQIDELSSKFGEEEIRAAFTVSREDLREALMKKFGELRVKNKYPATVLDCVREGRDELINLSFSIVSAAFKSASESKSLDKSFQGIMNESITAAIEQDFKELAGEVLIRRRMEPDQLIDKIREGR